MKKQYASVLLVLCLALGVGAEAQRQPGGVINVPFEFVAAGKTLPAGKYAVGRVSQNALGGLIISSYENRSAVYVLPSQFQSHSGSNVKVTFRRVGNTHILSKIQTADGVYVLSVPSRATAVAKVTQHEGASTSGTE